MKMERNKEMDEMVEKVWKYWHMPLDQMRCYYGLMTRDGPVKRGLNLIEDLQEIFW